MSIGLTIPVVALLVFLGLPLVLGLAPKDLVLLVLTFIKAASPWAPAGPTCCKAPCTS